MNTDPQFRYQPSPYVPFRDVQALERCRRIRREDMERHSNPDYRIRVVKDADLEFIWVTDMFHRIVAARDAGKELVLILPNPCPVYRHVARLINRFEVDCRHVRIFAMDEYANEAGEVAPETWPQGFVHALKRYFFGEIEPRLRMPETQIVGPTTANATAYSRMIEDAGGADQVYTGPGWTGHIAFVEPDAPEFDLPLDAWMRKGAGIVTLSPFTLAQNSLHGSFGMSGDIAAVPPKAFTIGPADVVAAKNRMDVHGITVHGTLTSWQRLITRLCLHGPVTPRLPTSLHQLLRTDVYVTETAAHNIEIDWDKGY
jgi:6-phosphogluconolactonase/glucosamine-6-phosphate isomerase/deaminase